MDVTASARLMIFVPIVAVLSASACGPAAVRGGAAEPVQAPRAVRSSTSLDARQQQMLDAHNARRAEHCAPALAWSDELAAEAQAWAEDLARRDCAFEHSEGGHGENLWAGTTGGFSVEQVVQQWHAEVELYDFGRGQFGMDTGHFTQLVWQSTQLVGCGSSTCNGMDVWVCNYDPPGNWEGQFQENVLPATCR